jgi:RHS repeat-associated protein
MEIYPANAAPVPGTGQAFYYHADAEGSVRLVTDANAQIVNRYEYDSFGKRLSVTESVWQPYTWKAREWIGGGADQYYNRARFYDPQMGRFTSEDPLGFEGGDTNLFSFTWNNTKNWSDASGLCPSCEYGSQSSISQKALMGGGAVAGAGAFATAETTAAALAAGNLATLSTIAGRIACTFFIVADAMAVYTDPSFENIATLAVDAASCGVRPRFKKPPPKSCPFIPGQNSFDGDTMVWIKEGLKSIRDIEVGEHVLAWDPITNAPTLKPVVAISSRMADGDVWRLTLQDAAGKRTTTIVTGNHPYLMAANDNAPLGLAANDNRHRDLTLLRIAPGGDWKIVQNLKPGDKIRTALNGRLDGTRLLTGAGNDLLDVVSIDLDRSPRRVYNFEVEGLHSYAVGELGEWVHNAPNDQHFGLPKGFWNWYHRVIKKSGDPDLTKDEAKNLYDEWCGKGNPGPDTRRKRGPR